MFNTLLKSKIHHAHVTDANINYVGSITIDSRIMERANILPFEKVLVVDVENGARFETYTMQGEAGSGTIQLNGAAARLAAVGDRVIIMAFTLVDASVTGWTPTIVVLNEKNEMEDCEDCEGC